MARRVWRVKPRFWLLMMGVMLSLFSFVWSSQQELIEQKAALIEELQLTKENMEIEIAQAQRQLQFSKSDEYIERIARTRGLVMPNEVLYVDQYTYQNTEW